MPVPGTFTQAQNARYTAALDQPHPHAFAVEHFRRQLEQGYTDEQMARLQGGAGGPKRRSFTWEIRSSLFIVTKWHGHPWNWRRGVRRLISEAKQQMQGAPEQLNLFAPPTLWDEE